MGNDTGPWVVVDEDDDDVEEEPGLIAHPGVVKDISAPYVTHPVILYFIDLNGMPFNPIPAPYMPV